MASSCPCPPARWDQLYEPTGGLLLAEPRRRVGAKSYAAPPPTSEVCQAHSSPRESLFICLVLPPSFTSLSVPRTRVQIQGNAPCNPPILSHGRDLIRSPAKAFPDHHAAWGHQW